MSVCPITSLPRGTRARVAEVQGEGALRSRLAVLGVRPGEEVTLLRVSPLRRTYLIATEESVFALGKEAASCVKAER